MPDPWSEERLGGEPRQELTTPQTHHRSAQLPGEQLAFCSLTLEISKHGKLEFSRVHSALSWV